MLNYEKKYLKYKIKYLELKNQIGGLFDCRFMLYNQDSARKAFTNKCNVDKKVDLKKFQIKHLRVAGFSAEELEKWNFSEKKSHYYWGFSAKELKEAGFSAKDFKNCNDDMVADYKDDAYNLKFNANILKEAGFSAKELKEAGFSVRELVFRYNRYTDPDLEEPNSGFSAKELKDVGFSLKDLIAGFGPLELKAAGYTIADLKAAGFTTGNLKAAGFTAADFKAAGYTAADLKAAGFKL